ncbi:hypothetical protein MTR67_053109 [Solanum verrucosum]|uniref:DUF4219 domain-containing protein n=1 Tax=Solanum verrucosum TaxID=315347 RepID=A0AAF0V928_SOLVR|nr:hypothetical protein MTR67_053109 [Solanum verrucosum]
MASLLNQQRTQSSTRPPLFKGQFYRHWRIRMRDYLMVEDIEVWDMICEGPYVPTMEVKVGEKTRVIPKTIKQYNDSDKQLVRKNHKAKKLLMCGIRMDEYDQISSCESAKEIWDLLRNTYEGTEETRKSKLDFFTVQFKSFTINEGKPVHEMHTRFSTITDELLLLEEPVPLCRQVSKILEISPKSWTNGFVIGNKTTEPEEITLCALFEHLQAYEMHIKGKGLIFKGEDMRADLTGDADRSFRERKFF